MTIEEVIEKANSGDVQAMMEIGGYCMMHFEELEDPVGGLEMAQKYLEMAARTGNVKAMDMLCGVADMQAYLEREVVGINSEQSLMKYKYLYDWCLREVTAFNQCGTEYESVDANELVKKVANAKYNYALACYYCNQEEKAYQLAHSMNEEHRALILEAYIEVDCGLEKVEHQGESLTIVRESIDKLIIAVSDKTYLSEEKTKWEEIMLVHAIIISVWAARSALGKIDLAIQILDLGRRYIKTESCLQLIDEERAHYSKNIFGKYVYKT